jgi:ubiquinone biosynthesis protein
MERSYRDWDRLVKVLPGSLADVLSGLRGETFELKLSHHRLEESVHRSVIGILSAALFLGASQLLSRASQDAVGYGANGIGLVFLVVASILAVRLGRAIHKAEKQKDA